MATANSVADLADASPATLTTLAEEVRARDRREAWRNEHELLAQIHELLQLMRVEQLIGLRVRPSLLPKVVPLARPGDEDAVEKDPEPLRVFTARDLAAMTSRGG